MTLAKKFAIFSLVLMILTGAGSWLAVRRVVRAQLFQETLENTNAARRAAVRHLKPSDFSRDGPGLNDRASLALLYSLTFGHFDLINIWSPDGRIVYSSDRSLAGAELKISDNLKRALSGKTVVEEWRALDPSHEKEMMGKKSAPYLEIYAPIKIEGRIVGALESYSDLSEVSARTSEFNINVMGLMSGGLAVLWLMLFGVVRRASTTIDKQNRDLRRFADEQSASLAELKENYLGTLRSLSAAVEARSGYTSGHSWRTKNLSLLVGQELNLSPDQLDRLGPAAALHDIGKIGTPEAILEKPGPLTDKEWETMKTHTIVGEIIVAAVPFLAQLAPIIRGHHERYDGTGYPDGLAGERIPIEARVLAIADAFDALTSDRSYRSAVTKNEALSRLRAARGTWYDPAVVDAFLRVEIISHPGRQRSREQALSGRLNL